MYAIDYIAIHSKDDDDQQKVGVGFTLQFSSRVSSMVSSQ
jgi:hypothetical protein